jgi:hypothetical protein
MAEYLLVHCPLLTVITRYDRTELSYTQLPLPDGPPVLRHAPIEPIPRCRSFVGGDVSSRAWEETPCPLIDGWHILHLYLTALRQLYLPFRAEGGRVAAVGRLMTFADGAYVHCIRLPLAGEE